MNARRLEVISLCVGTAVGYTGSGSLPVWIAAMNKVGPLSAEGVSYLATGELTLITLAVLISSGWVQRFGPRSLGAFCGMALVLANGIAILPSVPSVIAGRLLSGFAMGVLLATVTRVALQRVDVQRVLALTQTAAMALVSVVYFTSATLVGRFGPAGIFGFLGLGGLAVILASLAGFPRELFGRETPSSQIGNPGLPAYLAGLALLGVCLGQGLIGVQIVVIGGGLGIPAQTLGRMLAIVTPIAMLGSLTAHRLGERWGLVWPLAVALVALALDPPLLVTASTAGRFGVCAALLNISLMFYLPYGIALFNRIDTSGRLAGAAPAFILLGIALSPVVGSRLIAVQGFRGLATASSTVIVASALVWLVASARGGVRLSLLPTPEAKRD